MLKRNLPPPPNMNNDKYSGVVAASPMELRPLGYDDTGRFTTRSKRVRNFEGQQAFWLLESMRTKGVVLGEIRHDTDIMGLLREPGQEWRFTRDLKFALGHKTPSERETQTCLQNIGRRASAWLGVGYVEADKPVPEAGPTPEPGANGITCVRVYSGIDQDLAARVAGRIEYWKEQIRQDPEVIVIEVPVVPNVSVAAAG